RSLEERIHLRAARRHRHQGQGQHRGMALEAVGADFGALKMISTMLQWGQPAEPQPAYPRLYLPITRQAFCRSLRGRLKVLSGFHCLTVHEAALKRTRRLIRA